MVTARVHRLMDFGAFVNIQDDNGDLHGEVCKAPESRFLPVLIFEPFVNAEQHAVHCACLVCDPT